MANYNDTEIARIFETAWEIARERADVLFGDHDNPPAEELEIIFDASLNFEAKRAQLRVLRGESVKPRSFDKRLTNADYLHARGMGIKLAGGEDEIEQARR
jgi:hypothetical protein